MQRLRAEEDRHLPAWLVDFGISYGRRARVRANAKLAPAVSLLRQEQLLERQREQPPRLRDTEGD